MPRCITLRFALPVLLAATLLAALTLARSQDSPSVAEAARRAREQKKTQAKPAKVITEDDVKPAVQSNTAAPASPDVSAVPSAPAPAASTAVSTDNTAAPSTPSASSSPASDAKDQKDSREVTELKALLKQAQSDLDLLLREQTLDQDTFYSNSDYAHDTAGKAKLDAEKLQASDKQQELERLKARLAAMLPPSTAAAPVPPKP